MASDLGATPVVTEFRGQHETRQIWVRTIVGLSLSVHLLIQFHTVCPVHPVVHHLPTAVGRASARYRCLPFGHHDDDLRLMGPRHLWPDRFLGP